jgi:hypothetical protein
VLAYIESCGERGATCDEAELALGMSHQTASARISEMSRRFLTICDSGVTRPTRSGRAAIVYVARRQ